MRLIRKLMFCNTLSQQHHSATCYDNSISHIKCISCPCTTYSDSQLWPFSWNDCSIQPIQPWLLSPTTIYLFCLLFCDLKIDMKCTIQVIDFVDNLNFLRYDHSIEIIKNMLENLFLMKSDSEMENILTLQFSAIWKFIMTPFEHVIDSVTS